MKRMAEIGAGRQFFHAQDEARFKIAPMLQLLLVLLLLVPLTATAQSRGTASARQHGRPNIVFWKTSPKSVDLLLGHVPQTNAIRLAQLKQTFTDLQCGGKRLREQTTPEGRSLLCTLPAAGPKMASGKDDPSTILVLAYYEHEGRGRSAVENWSGALMLPFLYHALSAAPRRHTFVFAEVDGEQGASALFGSFTPAQRSDLLGVVALDALGLGPARFYINPNDSSAYLAGMRLEQPLLQAAADQQLPAPDETLPRGSWSKIDVTRVFRHHDVPSILVHSVAWNERDIPGSARDTDSAIDRDTYMRTITLLADYAVELDSLQPSPRPRTSPGNPLVIQ